MPFPETVQIVLRDQDKGVRTYTFTAQTQELASETALQACNLVEIARGGDVSRNAQNLLLETILHRWGVVVVDVPKLPEQC